MKKVEEIRIGSIVTHDDYSQEIFIVKSIQKYEDTYVIDTIGGKNGTWSNVLDLINPVIVDEYLLLKFGFSKSKRIGSSLYVKSELAIDLDYKCCYIHGKMCYYHTEWLQVHQLQNLYFALTGDNLQL